MEDRESQIVSLIGEITAYRKMVKLLVGLNQISLAACESTLAPPLLEGFLSKLRDARGELIYVAPAALSPELQKIANSAAYQTYETLSDEVSKALKEFLKEE